MVNDFQSRVLAGKLPSGGLLYPAAHEIYYRGYLFGEVKRYSQSKLSAKERMKFVVSGIEASFPITSLTLSDAIYLGLMRRLMSFGSESFTLEVRCSGCGIDGSLFYKIEDLEFDELTVDTFPIIVTLGGEDYEMTPPTVEDFFQACDSGKLEDPVELVARMCRNKEYGKVYPVFNNLNGIESEALSRVDSLTYHGLKEIKHTCKACGVATGVDIEGSDALIEPFRKPELSPANLIRFGKALTPVSF